MRFPEHAEMDTVERFCGNSDVERVTYTADHSSPWLSIDVCVAAEKFSFALWRESNSIYQVIDGTTLDEPMPSLAAAIASPPTEEGEAA